MPAVELGLESGNLAQLSRANRREIFRVAEEQAPLVTEPVMEADFAMRALLREIGRYLAELKVHGCFPEV